MQQWDEWLCPNCGSANWSSFNMACICADCQHEWSYDSGEPLKTEQEPGETLGDA